MKPVAELGCSKNKIFVQLRVRIVQCTTNKCRPFGIKMKRMAWLGFAIRQQ